jgi:hypothetical protein
LLMNWIKNLFAPVENTYEALVADFHTAKDRVFGYVASAHGEADALIAQAAKMKAEANKLLVETQDHVYAASDKVHELADFIKSPAA